MRKDIFEIHKPSALITSEYKTPIVRRGRIKGYEHYNLTPIQHDAMNYMCYLAREQIHKKMDIKKVINDFDNADELFKFLEIQHFEIDLNELSKFTEKYKLKQNKKELSAILDSLRAVSVKVGIFKQDALLGEIHSVKTMSLLRNYTRVTNSNKADFQLEPEILFGWIHKTKPFAKLYLKIQTKLKLTYSKILYEICKDYEKLNKPLTKNFSDWVKVLGIDNTLTATKTVGQFKQTYLNKAIKEINTHTDIFIDKIYGKKKNGITLMTVEFHKQKCDLIDNQEPELPIEEQIKYNKKRAIAEQRLEQSKQFQDIKDEEAWLKKTIHSITDEFLEQQELNKQFKEQIDNIDIKDYGESLMQMYGDVIGLKDYKLIYVFDETKPALTNNAQETYDILLKLDNEKEDEN